MSTKREYPKLKAAIGNVFGTFNKFAKYLGQGADSGYVYDVLHGHRDFLLYEQQGWARTLTGGLHTDPLWIALTDETSPMPKEYLMDQELPGRDAKPLPNLKIAIKRKFITQKRFAEHIQEDQVQVSHTINGRTRLSENRKKLWAKSLGFEPDDVEFEKLLSSHVSDNTIQWTPGDMAFNHTRTLLQSIIEKHETITAFAWNVGESPGSVSKVLKGKQELSGIRRDIWCNALGYPLDSPEFDNLLSGSNNTTQRGEDNEIQASETT